MIKLIINADDFGYSKIFDEKILDLLEKDYIRSTTVMVDFVTKNQVNHLIELNNKKQISVGLHIVFDLKRSLNKQIEKQLNKFKKIFGFNPSHLDHHKFINDINCIKTVNKFAEKLNLPTRYIKIKPKTKHTTHPVFITIPFDLHKSISFLDKINNNESCEILCHPGAYDPNCKSILNKEREMDYKNIIKLQNYLKKHPNISNLSYKEL